MKKDYDYDIFLKQMEHITLYWNSNFRILKYPNISRDVKGVWHSQYKYNTDNNNKKEYEFNIPKEIFYKMRDNTNCYICNKEPSNTHKNGIDRINNDFGYEKANIMSCCGMCNLMKKDLSLKDFLKYCNDIYKYQKKIKNI